MKYKKIISGIVLLAIVVMQAIMILGAYVSLKYQIDDVHEIANPIINNIHKIVNTLTVIIMINWAIIGIMFVVVLMAYKNNTITNK